MGCIGRAAEIGAMEVERGPRKSLDCARVGNWTIVIFIILCFIADAQLGETLIVEYFWKSNFQRY